MSKKKIVFLSVLVPVVALIIVAVGVAFASRPHRPDSRPTHVSVADRFNDFSKAFTLDSFPKGESFQKLVDIRNLLGRTPGLVPDAGKQVGTIGCDASFCALKLTFANTAALDQFATNYAVLKGYRDWPGAKFSATLLPKDPTDDGSHAAASAAAHAQLIIGLGGAGPKVPAPSPQMKEASMDTAAATSCKWSDAKNTRHSIQLSASACAGSNAASFPLFPNDDGLGTLGSPWESVHMHAFMPVTIPSSAGPTTISIPMTQGAVDANGRGVLICPVPYETGKQNLDTTSVPTKLCATVALLSHDNQPNCRIRWIASQGDDASKLNVEHLSGAQRPPGASAGVKVTNPMVDDVDPAFYTFFNIDPDTQMTELTGMDVLCAGMQADDRVVRYRLDYEVKPFVP